MLWVKNGEAKKISVIFSAFARPTKIRAVTVETTTEGNPDLYFETRAEKTVWSAGCAALTGAAHL